MADLKDQSFIFVKDLHYIITLNRNWSSTVLWQMWLNITLAIRTLSDTIWLDVELRYISVLMSTKIS